MNTISNSRFKQWQPLPLPSRSVQDKAEATRSPECRTSELAGPSCAKPERGECRSRQAGAGQDAVQLAPDRSTIQVFPRP